MCQNMRYKYKLLIVSILRYVVNILEGGIVWGIWGIIVEFFPIIRPFFATLVAPIESSGSHSFTG